MESGVIKATRRMVLVGAVCLTLGAAGTATAGKLLTGDDIKDGSIQLKDLSKKAQHGLHGQTGAQGAAGTPGAPGTPGQAGSPAPAVLLGSVFITNGPSTLYTGPQGVMTGTLNQMYVPIPVGSTVTVRDLTVKSSVSPGAGSYTVTLRVNATDALSCLVIGPNTTCNSGATVVTLNPGDLVEMRIDDAVSTPSGYVGWGVRLAP
jgi:hypothetical protein